MNCFKAIIKTLVTLFLAVAVANAGAGSLSTDTAMPSPDTATSENAIESEAANLSRTIPKDVFLVLDNSGSMKKNDPGFLTSRAVLEFINSLDETTRVAIIIFDEDVKMAVPLTTINLDSRTAILNSLDQVNYEGQYSNSPAAIEKAIYELKTNARDDASKLIVFMTDGIVDTGQPERDLEKARWLKTDLAEDARESGISIYGIAFTEGADFELIQSLAQKTDGEYFRVLEATDLERVFSRINELVKRMPESEAVAAEPDTVADAEATPTPAPVIIEVPVESAEARQEERLRSVMLLTALSVLIIAVIVMVAIQIRSYRRKFNGNAVQEAYLNDINGVTSRVSYKLGNKPVMLGRVAGTATEQMDYIVIPEPTIGRRHALITYKDYSYWISDQGSINGTYVNDEMVTDEVRLKHGDRIRLHKIEFEFIVPDMVEADMTALSNTVLASSAAAHGIYRGAPDFNVTGEADSIFDDSDTVRREPPEEEQHGDSETIVFKDDETVAEDDIDVTLRPDSDDAIDSSLKPEKDDDLDLDNFIDLDDRKSN